MQKRRKSRDVKTTPIVSTKRVFRETALLLKYEFWVERLKFARGESDFETLHQKADAFILAIEHRRRQAFAEARRKPLKLHASELIATPFF